VLGLPERVRACLFDLDGVLTETAKIHAAGVEGDVRRLLEGPGRQER
jgi:hypothetical protein